MNSVCRARILLVAPITAPIHASLSSTAATVMDVHDCSFRCPPSHTPTTFALRSAAPNHFFYPRRPSPRRALHCARLAWSVCQVQVAVRGSQCACGVRTPIPPSPTPSTFLILILYRCRCSPRIFTPASLLVFHARQPTGYTSTECCTFSHVTTPHGRLIFRTHVSHSLFLQIWLLRCTNCMRVSRNVSTVAHCLCRARSRIPYASIYAHPSTRCSPPAVCARSN